MTLPNNAPVDIAALAKYPCAACGSEPTMAVPAAMPASHVRCHSAKSANCNASGGRDGDTPLTRAS